VRRRNPLTHALLLAAIALAPSAALASPESEAFVDRAQRAESRGDGRAALIHLKNAVKADPTDARARHRLGALYLAAGDAAGARKELARALALGTLEGAEGDAAQADLGRALLALGETEEALATLRPDAVTDPDARLRVRLLRAAALERLDRLDEARSTLEGGLDGQGAGGPAVARIQVALARLDRREGHLQAAARRLSRAVELAPAEPQIWTERGQAALAAGRPRAAEDAFAEALRQVPGDLTALLGRARAALARNDPEAALEGVRALRAAHPGHPLADYLEGQALFQAGRPEEAREPLQRVLQVLPDDPGVHVLLAGVALALDLPEQAREHAGRAHALAPGLGPALRMHLAALLANGEPGRALDALDRAMAEAGSKADPVLTLLGARAALEAQRYRRAGELLDDVEGLPPGPWTERLSRARGVLHEGEPDAALALLRGERGQGAASAPVDVAGWLRMGAPASAVATATQAVEDRPEDPVAWNRLGVARLAAGDEAQAEQAFRKAVALSPDAPGPAVNLAALALRRGNPEAALAGLRNLLERNPTAPGLRARLAAMERATGHPRRAEALLREVLERDEGDWAVRLRLADLYRARGDAARARQVLDHSPGPDTPRLLAAAGNLHLTLGDPQGALTAYAAWAEQAPGQAEPQVHLARAHAAARHLDQAAAAIARALALEPGHLGAQVLSVRLDLATDHRERAVQALDGLLAEHPKSALVQGLAGDLALLEGRADDAIAAYGAALALRPGSALALRLARTRWAAGQREAAVEGLSAWLKRHPDDRPGHALLAEQYLKLGREGEARAVYDTLLRQSPEDLLALNNAAMLWLPDDPARSLDYALRAAELAPERAEVLDTLALAHLENGQQEPAMAALDRALKAAPDYPTARFHRALALSRSGQAAAARDQLQALLAEDRRFPEEAEARALLETLGR
jgi:putative PEP-CTERM system TPR-repeat lipoprotein